MRARRDPARRPRRRSCAARARRPRVRAPRRRSSCRRRPCRSRTRAPCRVGGLPSARSPYDNGHDGPGARGGLRNGPADAAPARPHVLPRHPAPAARAASGDARAVRLRAHRRPDRRRPEPGALAGSPARRPGRLGGGAPRRRELARARRARARRRRQPPPSPARRACDLHALDADRLRAGAHLQLGGARRLHGRLGRLGRADHGLAARRPGARLRPARPRVPARELHPRRRRAPPARPRLPPRLRPRPLRRRGIRSERLAGRPRAARAARARGRPRPRAVRVGRARRGVRAALDPPGRADRDRALHAHARPCGGRRLRRAAAPARRPRARPARRGGEGAVRRRTLRGDERTPLDERADVLICGASFAGLAVARELAGSGADVLVVDRYEIGERATSACAAPTVWLQAMGVERAVRQEIPCMAFHTPHGSARFRLPWSWSSFDYRDLCRELWAQCDARFEVAKVDSRTRGTVHTDRGVLTAPLIVDALGWRRVLGPGDNVQPPEAAISRGLEVHPHGAGLDLDVWIDRSLVRKGYAWSVPARGEQRVGVGSYAPRDRVRGRTKEIPRRLDVDAVRYQGNWFPHRLRPATEDGVFFARDSAGHCFPLSGEGIRTAFYFGIAAGREIRAAHRNEKTREQALDAYGRFSAGHAPAFARALALQRAIPRLPPRALTALLGVMSRERPSRRAFTWYLEQAHPRLAGFESIE